MIVGLLRCHNGLCSCPAAGQARNTSLTVGEYTTLSCRVGLLVKAYCAVIIAGWCVGRIAESPRRARARYLDPMPRPAGAARLFDPSAEGTARRMNDLT